MERRRKRNNRLLDTLTGVYSRDSLDARLREEIARGQRHAQPFSLVLIDLDHFKSVNDGLGHLRGDAVLVEAAQRFKNATRRGDLVFRFGGDEFLLLLHNTNKASATILAKRIQVATRDELFAGDPPLKLTCSMGVADFPGDGQTVAAVLAAADRRTYQAKRMGRDRVFDYDIKESGEPSFDDKTRLIERDEAQEKLYNFIESMPGKPRSVLRITGRPGSGLSRFIYEVGNLAALRGYAVLTLRGTSALQRRICGALGEIHFVESLPDPALGAKALAETLNRRVALEEKAGLVLLIDNLQRIDRATLVLLHDLYFASDMGQLAVVYSDDSAGAQINFLNEVEKQKVIHLLPFSQQGVRLWLRHSLQWEAPQDFISWLYAETEGFPATLRRAVELLIKRNLLRPAPDGWQPAAGLTSHTEDRLGKLLEIYAPRILLPPVKRDFVGRDLELQRVKHLLREQQLVTILGAGGLGKTHLALQAAWEVAGAYRDGVCFVPLGSLRSIEYLLDAIANSLQFALRSTRDLEKQLIDYLSGKEMLLVLDSFEHLLDAAPMLEEMANQAPMLDILVTSRQRLVATRGAILEIDPLEVPPAQGTEKIESFPSVQLFLHDAWWAWYQGDRPALDWEAIGHICRLVHGIPLGLEMAAAWTATMSLSEIELELERSVTFLLEDQEGRGGSEPGQRSSRSEGHKNLNSIFDAFWRTLSTYEKSVLGKLSLFRGGFSQEAAASVADASTFFLYALSAQSYLGRVSQNRLHSFHKSGVEPSTFPRSSGRYQMHLLLQQYVRDLVHGQPEEDQAMRAFGAYYATFLSEREKRMRQARAAIDEVFDELDNIRAAWDYLLDHSFKEPGFLEMITQAAGGLARFYLLTGRLRECRQVFDYAVNEIHKALDAQDSERNRVALAALLLQKAQLHMSVGESSDAFSTAEEAWRLLAVLLTEPTSEGFVLKLQALALQVKGTASLAKGKQDEAIYFLNESIQAARHGGDQIIEADSTRFLGNVYLDQVGKLQQAEACYQVSLEICRAMQDRTGEGGAFNNLGLVALTKGDFETAYQSFEQMLAIAQELDDPISVATAQVNQTIVDTTRNEYARARMTGEAAEAQTAAIGAHELNEIAIWGLGYLDMVQGDFASANLRLEKVKDQMQARKEGGVEDPLSWARLLCDLGLLYQLEGRLELGRTVSEEAVRLCLEKNISDAPGYALTNLGYIYLELARDAEGEKRLDMLRHAKDAFQESVQTWEKEDRMNLKIEAMASLGLVYLHMGDLPKAVEHVEGAFSLFSDRSLLGVLDPARIFMAFWEVMQAKQDPRATRVLEMGWDHLVERADKQADTNLRQSLLNIPSNRALAEAAQAYLPEPGKSIAG